MRADGSREFAHAAAVAIRATPFGPGTRRREPVDSTVTILVRFRLDSFSRGTVLIVQLRWL